MQIHVADNILIIKNNILQGDEELFENMVITFNKPLGLGHKIAARNISKGEKIIKFGVAIGSATMDIPIGSHIHLHNMKSDYITTYTLDHEFISDK